MEGPIKFAALARIQQYRAIKGERAYATALFQGQYSDPSGIGFGGHKATWSNQIIGKTVKRYAAGVKHAALIDIHTGLGPFGYGMLITTSEKGNRGLALAQIWHDKEIVAIRERPEDIPYEVHGDLCGEVERLLPNETVVSIALEYGTYEVDRLLGLQIDDYWLMNHGNVHSSQGHAIRSSLQDFFYPNDVTWRSMVTSRFDEVIARTISGLSAI